MAEPSGRSAHEPDACARARRLLTGNPRNAAAVGVFVVALLVYIRTMLPGPSFGDWAEMQFIPAELGVPHPTGYPLYILLGKAFSLLPVGSLAYRADLLSAFAAAGAAGTSVLISIRLGVRPLIAAIAGLSLAVTGTLWLEATFSEMNGLHLFLMALVVHRALVWRTERRPSDLLLGGLFAGLSVANHLLAITVLPIIIGFVLIDARRTLAERPALLVQAALLFLAGASLYLLIPLRALAGPPAVYGPLTTWAGLSSLITGAQFRGEMHFGTLASLGTAMGALPTVLRQIQDRANVAFLVGGLIGGAILGLRDRWAAAMLGLVALVNVYFFATYVGLAHYLLVTWLILAVWLSVAAEELIAVLGARLKAGVVGTQVLLVVLPIALAAGNWATHDQAANQVGETFAAGVFAHLPPNAVLLTYWDVLTNLSYVHCVEGQRPDVSLRAYDSTARVTCDPVLGSLEEVARSRPVFALFAFGSELDPLRTSFNLVPGPVLALPYGDRVLDHSGTLYQLELKNAATTSSTPRPAQVGNDP